ncbi:hypothetical protein [Plastoroseomonas arctica]|uniref:Uncharacterized protein n=1 Tax=Plastoroseomonas arctica TaxID=1509237 RepID=A0AAF1K2U1_9PROT|nr:hypothetical protein [Plastoroseomonas arctica]MBR0655401.1 hypothetical protein [Plastoroseomonas arctica]
MPEGPDDTVRIIPAHAPVGQGVHALSPAAPIAGSARSRGILVALILLLVVVLGGSITAWVIFAGPRPETTAAATSTGSWSPQPNAAAIAVPAEPIGIPGVVQAGLSNAPVQRSLSSRVIVPVLDEQSLLAHAAPIARLFRLRENPLVFILDFPSLDEQGAAMNRLAALVEKAGQPRDRVLDDAALARAISEAGDTAATYYYGHNYRASDIDRFFALAWRDRVTLTPGEEWLRLQHATARELVGDVDFAVLSIPGVERRVDASMRAAILHHEIGHGHFFTRPSFAAHVNRVWREVFTEAERASFRRFLSSEGYDAQLEEVMVNETMAFVAFTPDRRFFNAGMVAMDDGRLQVLRAAFLSAF